MKIIISSNLLALLFLASVKIEFFWGGVSSGRKWSDLVDNKEPEESGDIAWQPQSEE
jgi:hypothetical protein